MTIKKIGQCCLVIKIDGVTLLTDPGSFSTAQNTLTGIDAILITHEHGDHFHVESLKEVLQHNPQATVITNTAVGKKLDALKMLYTVVEGRGSTKVKGVAIEAFDGKHEEIFGNYGQVQNTAYLIGNSLFYPGDAFHQPGVPVDVLALPVAGPWCKIGDALRYALAVKPKKAFPVHDAMLTPQGATFTHTLPTTVLGEQGITFVAMQAGDEREF